MVSARYTPTDSVAALPGDRIVVAGGGDGAELIDLASGHSRRSPSSRGRQSFSTVGVTHGQLAIVGGYDESIRLTRIDRTSPVDDL